MKTIEIKVTELCEEIDYWKAQAQYFEQEMKYWREQCISSNRENVQHNNEMTTKMLLQLIEEPDFIETPQSNGRIIGKLKDTEDTFDNNA